MKTASGTSFIAKDQSPLLTLQMLEFASEALCVRERAMVFIFLNNHSSERACIATKKCNFFPLKRAICINEGFFSDSVLAHNPPNLFQ